MKLPTVTRWSAGDQVDVQFFNDVSYALDFAMKPPQAWVVKTATQSVTPNTWVPVSLNSIVIDTGAEAGDAPVWTAANPTKLYPQTPGWYDIEANVSWTSLVDNAWRILGIRHSGNDGIVRVKSRIDVASRGATKQRMAHTWFVNGGDSIEMVVWSAAAAATTVTTDTTNSMRPGIRLRWFSM